MTADWYPFYIGALFGFGAGVWFAYFLFRMPQIRAARKAAKTRRKNKLKETVSAYITKFAKWPFNATIISAIAYYRKFSPGLFEGLSDADVVEVIKDLESDGFVVGGKI